MDRYCGTILLAIEPGGQNEALAGRLREAAEGSEILVSRDEAQIESALDRIEIVIGNVPFPLLGHMPRLAWVQIWSAGADGLQKYPELKALPFTMTSVSGIHGRQITEHVFGLLLAWRRNLPQVFAAQARHEWLKIPQERLSVLAGKNMLILGYGAIGRQTAQAALAFGMKVTGVRRHAPSSPVDDLGVRLAAAAEMGTLLKDADVVVNILPLTPETRHCIGKAEFAAMKAQAVYINVGRGATTDTEALIDALKTGQIAAALLDVMESEPLPPESPLWEMENVLLTGHYAGWHPEYEKMAMEVSLENLGRFLRREPLINLIDKDAGY